MHRLLHLALSYLSPSSLRAKRTLLHSQIPLERYPVRFMKAIEVLVNGQRLCVAGSGPPELTFVDFTLRDGNDLLVSLNVAGSREKMVPRWVEGYQIKEGDDVLIRIVD